MRAWSYKLISSSTSTYRLAAGAAGPRKDGLILMSRINGVRQEAGNADRKGIQAGRCGIGDTWLHIFTYPSLSRGAGSG